jgi:hypothetical protein
MVLTALVIPIPAVHAAQFVAPEGESASVRDEVAGDLYTASNSVIITAPVHGDIFAAGETVDISGSSDASIFAFGRSITVSGNAHDDIRVAGENISVTSDITHDLMAAGSTVSVSPTSSIGGDVYAAGSELTIAGEVAGSVRLAGEKLTVARTATIKGNLVAYGSEPIIEEGAKITGTVRTILPEEKPGRENRTMIASFARLSLRRFILALVILLLAPALVQSIHTRATTMSIKSVGYGLLITILALPAVLILFITGIGALLGFFVLTTALFLYVIGFGSAILLLGTWVWSLVQHKSIRIPSPLSWQQAIVGAVAASILSFIPFGSLILTVIFLIAVGASTLSIYERARGI